MKSLVPFRTLGASNGTARAGFPLARTPWPMDGVLDRFLAEVWGDGVAAGAGPGIRVDLEDHEDQLILRAEVPGVRPEDLDVSVNGEYLILSGEKRLTGSPSESDGDGQGSQASGETMHISERLHGTFKRTLQLPCAVDADGIEARYAHGVLTVQLPKAAEVRPKRIEVRTEG